MNEYLMINLQHFCQKTANEMAVLRNHFNAYGIYLPIHSVKYIRHLEKTHIYYKKQHSGKT